MPKNVWDEKFDDEDIKLRVNSTVDYSEENPNTVQYLRSFKEFVEDEPKNNNNPDSDDDPENQSGFKPSS